MPALTYANAVAGVSGLTISGVSSVGKLTAPPASVNVLPCSFPSVPTGGNGPVTVQGEGGWRTWKVDLVVLYEAVGQSTLPANFAGTLALMDAVDNALCGLTQGRAKLMWTIRLDIYPVGNVEYWAVVASVEGRG